jgi:iron-sulfur cluster repair protein YtfE (RIC family)
MLQLKTDMHLQDRELSVDNYRKLNLRDLEQLYALRIVPHLNKSLDTICTLLKSNDQQKETPEYHARATALVQQFTQLCMSHSSKEMVILSALRTHQANDLSTPILELKKNHQEMRQILHQVSELTAQANGSPGCSALHRLGYAYLNNLRQDISRLFFLEEEYLFPRLPLLR